MSEVPFDFNTPEYRLAIGLIERTNQSFFLTGKAGTGKSTFLRHIVNTVKKDTLVLAPTGIAAINIGGVTIHSFFEFPLRQMLPEEPGIKTFWRESEKRKIISSLETVIIDEVSMVRADLIDAIDCSLRRNGGNPNLPFGGKQVVFVGDLFQLEPILPAQGKELSYKQIYGNGHFYNAQVFKNIAFPVLELTRPHRQQDEEFINLLDKVRMNEVSSEDIEKLNTRVSQQYSYDYALTLTTRADAAENINKARVSNLSFTAITYSAQVSGTFESARFPTDDKLILKKGAQIIFVRNDSERRWVNGTIGKIEDLTGESVLVRLSDNSLATVERVTWEQIRYEFDESRGRVNGKVIGKFVQYPLKLAWAITIHKSQGMSLDQAIIDFGSGAFAGGQAYVALSRVRTMAGLFLNQPIKQTDIIVDESLKAFVRSLPAATTALLADVALSINSKNSGKIAGYYFRTAFEKLPLAGETVALDNLTKAFAHLTSDQDLSFADSLVVGRNNALDEESIDSLLLKGIILFYEGKLEHSLKAFIDYEVQTELSYFFISKCCLALKDYENALKYIELSLEQVRSSRNLYQKANVIKPRTSDSDRKQYVECLSDALLADPYSATVYTDVLAAMKADNFTAELPSAYEFEQQVNAIDLQQNFFKSIIRTVNRYRKKILNISARSGSAVQLPSNVLANWNANKNSTENNSKEDLEDFLEEHKEDLASDWLLD